MRPEILAPAGSKEALQAAIAAGCDAVYFGLPSFGARAFANNFTLSETEEIIKQCHLIGVKVYITMNTILFEDEIEEAYRMAKELHRMNVDALIIQDLGFIHLLHHRLPNLTLHASTQLSVSKPEMIDKLKELGVKRVVLARECTLDEIKACVNTGMEIEVFVHGALCICYSGQCYFSSVKYNRSGNRGACAQPCRMQYSLLQDGKKILESKYLLSPRDLSLIDRVKQLEELGVVSLKIEGRMKNAAYVYESVSQTKKVLGNKTRTSEDKNNLMVTFNRGYTQGHAFNKRGHELMNVETCNHQGIVIGKVIAKKRKRIQIKLTESLSQNDGLRFGTEVGCHVNYLYDQKGRLTNYMPAGTICEIEGPSNVKVQDIVRKTTSVLENEKVQKKIKDIKRQTPVNAHLSCSGIGYPLVCEITDGIHTVVVQTEDLATEAIKHSTDNVLLTKQMNKTKDSWAYFDRLTFELADNIYFSISSINDVRRHALAMLERKRNEECQVIEEAYTYQPPYSKTNYDIIEAQNRTQYKQDGRLWVCEFDKSKGDITSIQGDVVTQLGSAEIIDGMNITNSYGICALLELGYKQIVISDECSFENIETMMTAFKNRYGFDAPVLKTIYQRKRLMTMNHCMINTMLSDGQRKNCSLCHTHQFKIEGKDKNQYICIGDRNCHMRVFDNEIHDEIDRIPQYRSLNINHYKLCFVDETSLQIEKVITHLENVKA